ncbi:MAG: hypothetical protein A2018_01645 [Alphaproteobacteria bacterium GWF2_58_20]|nr:MAG: hypothetical protein A2018_01645 [Alphaproteobacteria bacterium GWF2_58_20]
MTSTSAMAADASKNLPLKRVILSTSGLGHFEHEGPVSGNSTVDLPVRLDQVDDILKSLVVLDATGRVSNVTLPGREPLQQAFRDLPFTETDLSSPVALLNALQGAEVKIDGSSKIAGRLLRVVAEDSRMGEETVTRHRVSVMTDSGLQQAVLENIDNIQFTSEKLRTQIREALDAMMDARTRDMRTLSVNLRGDGKRNVGLAYVVETPLWKSAYRMVLPPAGKESLVQGWAVVENMTGGDWNDVEMTLISGNPVTYRQPLYTSYYVSRPELPVSVLGRIMPRKDAGAVGMAEDMEMMDMSSESYGGGSMLKSLRRMDMAESIMPQMAMAPASANFSSIATANKATESTEAATQVLFRFPGTISLKAGYSMMLPFVSRKMPAERLWLYQPDVNADHPLAALRLKNDGDSSLPSGILTLYEQSGKGNATTFVGDADMPILAKGEERMVSFALDSKTTILRDSRQDSLTGDIRISGGVAQIAITSRAETTYTVKAPEGEDRAILIEHPKRSGWNLVAPDPKSAEVTDGFYRIPLKAPAGKSVNLKVVLEKPEMRSLQLLNLSSSDISTYLASFGKESPKARKAFETMASLRRDVDAVDAEIRALSNERDGITRDQERLRDNLESVPEDSDLARRYLATMDSQETRLETIAKAITEQEKAKAKAVAKLKAAIMDMSI